MKRSEINSLIDSASRCFSIHNWALPPNPRWDVTDFGLSDWKKFGLVLVNLADEKEYCEKLMYAQRGMTTPAHCHHKKKEDIISRWGTLRVKIWDEHPERCTRKTLQIQIDGVKKDLHSGTCIDLRSGSRITIVPGIYHEFFPLDEECIIGEVSSANDDLHDNYFVDPNIGRYPDINEDAPALVRLISEKQPG